MAGLKLIVGDILKSFVGHFWGNSKEWEEDPRPIKYVVGKNGLFEIHDTEIMMAVSRPETVRGMDVALREGIVFKTPKIPYQLYFKALNFMRDVYNRDKTEATILFFWDRDKQEHFLWVPKQANGGAASDYERDKDPEFTEMCTRHVWVMTAHSHPTFAGSFSSIDNADEKDTRLYMVVGKILGDNQDVALRTMVNGKAVNLGFYDVFTNPADELDATPQEWLAKCTKKTYAPVTTYRGGAAAGAYAQGRGAWPYPSYYAEDYYGYYNGVYGDGDPDDYEDIDRRFAHRQYGYDGPIGMDEVPEVDYSEVVSENPQIVMAAAQAEVDRDHRKGKKNLSVAERLAALNIKQLPSAKVSKR